MSILLKDDFSRYPAGWETMPYYGLRRIGPWETRNVDYVWFPESGGYHKQSQTWGIERRRGRSFLIQPDPNFASFIVAGDDAWRNYRFEAMFSRRPGMPRGSSFGCDHNQARGLTGLLARYQTQRQHYFWGLDADSFPLLARRCEEDMIPLYRGPRRISGLRVRRWAIEVQDERISVWLDGQCLARTEDRDYAWGRIGFRTDLAASFTGVRVTTSAAESRAIRRRMANALRVHRAAAAGFPEPVIWRDLRREPEWQRVHPLDVWGEGRTGLVHVALRRKDSSADPPIELLTLDGETVWKRGEWPSAGSGRPVHVTACMADLAGDGSPRLVVAWDDTVAILDPADGQTLAREKLPVTAYRSSEVVPPVLGRVFSAHLRSGPGRQIIAMTDGYAAALDARLTLLWSHTGNLGHGPAAGDVNGDGLDEVMLGYSLLDARGRVLWSVPGLNTRVNDDMLDAHADWVEFASLRDGEPPCVLLAASQKGVFMLDAQGHILRRHVIGHAQTVAVGRFDPGLEGSQVMAATLWESAGIYWLFDSRLRPIRRWELGVFTPAHPIRWAGWPNTLAWLCYYDRGPAFMDGFGRILWRLDPALSGGPTRAPAHHDGGVFQHGGMPGDLLAVNIGRRLLILAPR